MEQRASNRPKHWRETSLAKNTLGPQLAERLRSEWGPSGPGPDRALRVQAADFIDAVLEAIEKGGLDLGFCSFCGRPVVYLADGMPVVCVDCIPRLEGTDDGGG